MNCEKKSCEIFYKAIIHFTTMHKNLVDYKTSIYLTS